MIRPLRGRVVIRPDITKSVGHIILPEMSRDWKRNAERSHGVNARSSHHGTVLAIGKPALSKRGIEVPHGFAIGDRVVFVWTHNEGENTLLWEDGIECCWVPQENVIAVVAAGAKVEERQVAKSLLASAVMS